MVGLEFESSRAIADHLKASPQVWLCLFSVVVDEVELRLPQGSGYSGTLRQVRVEIFHQRCRRAVINRPEACDDALCAGSKKRSRQVHDAFLPLKATATGF